MKMLEKCQSNYMQVILTKIDRKSKPIKKHTKICDKSLKERKIDLEDEHFDLLQYVKDQAEIEEAKPRFKAPKVSFIYSNILFQECDAKDRGFFTWSDFIDVGGIKNKPKVLNLDDSYSFEEGNEGGLSPLYQNRPSFASFDPMQYGYEDLQDD